ncbi:protein-tyrosine phosphatase [Purpureocillium lilacinum]|uniref:protein-tyrosine-phosphatase n=1 Tax=Purpureocillium lilacinum TaxID=33203 RepID=A0A179HKD6_PURLI|nr:protein-tyrosine phosphatase [Purpureocillium lilacinum]OAQ84057.1 protein-tyrosine phosphatase [Purpureocillium lilacinum]OAQ90845.1 protein-tyrosine phosphatase [Purpureocillium lilacinum]GJN68379.1 cell division control protein 14 [Purpureocillium lilacinum]GJN77946.1 cell division control protein 14 [Purpureocillium lilacinum]
MAPTSRHAQNMGQIIEYIPDRLYLAAYVNPPSSDTLFPTPETPVSPRKRSQRAAVADLPTSSRVPPCYFTVDDTLLYNAFHHDFGPLHIGHLYRFAIRFHDILGAKENKDRPVVFWSAADPRSRANAACMLACYMVLIQNWPPHLALAPIAQVDPPLMPFRDAGYSQADYGITVQDVVYGVWKAKEEKCCDLDNFDLEMYEKFERVEHGDFNWITPHFLAFASPQHTPVAKITEGSELFSSLPRDLAAVDAHPTLPQPFKNVLRHFSEKNIGLVVRLNSPLYSPSYFEALGIQHLDMIFDDGTCPTLTTVRKFIRLAHETITVRKKGIAVHCKAGLGRTGCLIGAYLIYRHGFTADEVISFMRFMRPGMVVGPQQHWLHLNQGTFREWWIEERVERKLRREMAASQQVPSTPMRAMQKSGIRSSQLSTPPNRSPSNRTPLSEVDHDRNNVGVHEDYLPAPTPGQPRKTTRADRHHPYQRSTSHHTTVEEETGIEHETEIVTMHRHSQGAESDEEIHLRMRSHRKASQSPGRSAKVRSVSQTTSSIYTVDNDSSQDAENIGSMRSNKAERVASTPGVLTRVRGSKRAGSESPLRAKDSAGIRKTSGRVGSASVAASTARKVSGS